jgi:hypothetical protein
MSSFRARKASTLPSDPAKSKRFGQRGQLLVVFVLSIFVLMGFIALVIDVSWYWSNSLRVQRAADAAALAGAVDLPGNPGTQLTHPLGTGIGDALAEANKNGYTVGSGVTILAQQDSAAVAGGNPNQMDVTITAPVQTFFMRIFGVKTIQANRSSKALFTLPVPMGSPQNFYGDFGIVRDQSFTTTGFGGRTTQSDVTLTGPSSAGCQNGVSNCFQDTGGQALTPANGFWATMNTEGAGNIDGDAFQPFYDNAGGNQAVKCANATSQIACYDPASYYNYAISMPANTTGGHVYIFDPTFCETDTASGTGDRWFGSGSVSSWYELFGTNNTPYDLTDDGNPIATSGTLFRDQNASDSTMGGNNGNNECRQTNTKYNDARDYHDSWYLLNPGAGLSGGPNGTVYRLHTTTTAPAGQTDSINQKNTDGEQSFAIFANDAQGTTGNGLLPQVYGLGAMQMFTPLTAGNSTVSSSFYLAQVPKYYAGKTLQLNLWDPGDTSPLKATLFVDIPTPAGWSATPFTYTAHTGTTGGANSACNSNSNSNPGNNSVLTNVGNTTGQFNGCWLTLNVPIPTGYNGDQQGWWKITYSMVNTRSGTDTSNDVTTWTAQILGNPVHLIVP